MPTLTLTRRTLGAALACATACLLLVPAAFAASPKAPPGNSGVQEYVENVPDGTGGEVANNLYHGSNAAEQGGPLTEQLAKSGEDGERAGALAKAGAPKAKKGSSSGEAGDSPVGAAFERLGAAAGPGGMGFFLPLLLALLLGGALGYEVKRRRADA